MTQAIFLSYASQDADAARRICDALRAAGLEVWFDQNELTGGDDWDRKIRKQIKECSLFVPIISAHTNARPEGYFRLEWKLAVDRSHLMADNVPFFFPVLSADVAEASAMVPDKFRERQWTRLNDEESVVRFAALIQQVVSAPPSGATVIADLRTQPQTTSTRVVAAAALPSRRRTITTLAGLGVMGAAGLAIWRPWQSNAIDASKTDQLVADPQLERAAQLIERLDAIASDVDLAEDLVKAALAKRPADAAATVLMARVQTYFLTRGFDTSAQRFVKAKQSAERAITIAPTDPDAMASLAGYLDSRGVDLPRASRLLREAIAIRPDEPRYYRLLGNNMSNIPGTPKDEVVDFLKGGLQKFPNDTLMHYEIARKYRDVSMVPEMEYHLNRAIELGRLDSAFVLRARYKLYLHGDLDGMKADLDQLSERGRSTDRAILSQFTYALMASKPDVGIQALSGKPEPWIGDYEFSGPAPLLLGELLLLQGKLEFAKQQFEFALVELSKRQNDVARDISLMGLEAWLMMRLGRLQDAKNRHRLLLQEIKRPYRINLFAAVSFTPIPLSLLLGQRQDALLLLREAVAVPIAQTILRSFFNLDPRLVKFRRDTEITALLAAREVSSTHK